MLELGGSRIEIITAIVSQTLIFRLSTIVKTRFQNVLYHWSLVHIKVSSRRVWKLALKEMAKAHPNFDIVNHKGEGHEKQIVSDSMNTHNDYYLKFCILCSIVLTIQKVCRLNLVQVSWVRCGKTLLHCQKTIVKF